MHVNMPFMKMTPEVMPPILSYYPTTSDVDIGGMAANGYGGMDLPTNLLLHFAAM